MNINIENMNINGDAIATILIAVFAIVAFIATLVIQKYNSGDKI